MFHIIYRSKRHAQPSKGTHLIMYDNEMGKWLPMKWVKCISLWYIMERTCL